MKKIVLSIFIIYFMLITLEISVNALNEDSVSNELKFSYYNEIPKNQIDKEATYFDLEVKPDSKQTLITNVKNETNKSLKVDVSVQNASTSSSGILNYTVPIKIKEEDVLKLTDIVDVPKSIELKPYESKKLEIKLNLPKKEFDGIILGAVKLQEHKKNTSSHVSNESVSIDNEYSYVYTISLKENNKELSTRFKDNDSFVKNNYINVSFRNDIAKIVNNIKIESTLKKEGSDKVLDTFSVDKYTMAPNSDIEIPMFDKANLDDGNYITTTTITNGKKNWKFTSKIKLDSKETDNVDSIVESSKPDSNNKFIIVTCIFVTFFLLTGVLYFILKKYKFK